MKNISKRIMSLALSSLMVLTTIPAASFAADNVPEDRNVRAAEGVVPPAVTTEPVELNNTNFKDELLITKLKAFDTDNNNILSIAEIEKIKELDFSNIDEGKISDIKGLEKLTHLEILNLSGNNLTSVDLSPLKSLISVNLSENPVSQIKIMDNPKLEELDLEDNNVVLDTLDLRGCHNLKWLAIRNTEIKTLNCSGLTKLKGYNGTFYETLTAADFTNCKSMEIITINSDVLKKLTLKGCTGLRILNVSQSGLENLDLQDCQNLTVLDIQFTNIKNLDLSSCRKLIELNATNSPLTELDLSACKLLENLYLNNCLELKKLNANTCKELQELRFANTGITDIDFKNFKKLKVVRFENTPIKKADLSLCTQLENISYGNNMNDIQVVKDNNFKTFKKLKSLSINFVYEIKTLDISENNALEELYVSYAGVSSIKFKNNHNLKIVYLNNVEPIKNIDLSGCPKLIKLTVNNCKVENLNLINNKELRELSCSYVPLKYLDLTGLTKLSRLYCDHNNLAYINISGCPELLDELYCVRNTFYIAGNNLSEIKGFDVTKVSNVRNGSIKNGQFVFSGNNPIEYTYDIGNGVKADFSVCKRKQIPDFRIASKVVYTGKEIRPEVRTSLNEGDYTVTYGPGRVNPGRYYVKVTGKGKYQGTKTKYFTIVPKAPSQVTTRLARGDGNDLYTYWTKVPSANGYNVYYRLKGNTKWTFLTRTQKLSILKNNLPGGKTYQFKVSPYIVRNNVRYDSTAYRYAGATTLKKVNIPSVTRVNSSQVRVKWNNILAESGYQISRAKTKTGRYVVYTWRTTTGNNRLLKPARGTTYYYRVRAFRDVKINGKYERIYGMWSDARAYRLK